MRRRPGVRSAIVARGRAISPGLTTRLARRQPRAQREGGLAAYRGTSPGRRWTRFWCSTFSAFSFASATCTLAAATEEPQRKAEGELEPLHADGEEKGEDRTRIGSLRGNGPGRDDGRGSLEPRVVPERRRRSSVPRSSRPRSIRRAGSLERNWGLRACWVPVVEGARSFRLRTRKNCAVGCDKRASKNESARGRGLHCHGGTSPGQRRRSHHVYALWTSPYFFRRRFGRGHEDQRSR